MRAVGFAGPIVAGVLSYAIEAYHERAFFSKYALYSGLELFLSSFLGNLTTGWINPAGFIGLGAEIGSDAISGLLYMLMRKMIHKENDTKLNSFVYGFALSYAGQALANPIFSAFSTTRLAIDLDTMSLTQDYGAKVVKNELLTSNTVYPPGSATPIGTVSVTGPSTYSQPCMWTC